MSFTSFSLFDEDAFFASSVFGAHMNNLNRGFGVKSVQFLLDVFVNWVTPTAHHRQVPLVDEAVMTYMDLLIEGGFAKKLSRKSPPRYRLTESGIIELIKRVTRRSYHCQPEEFFFAFSYLQNYTSRTIQMMKNKGAYFQYDLRLEVESLLDLNAFVDHQLDISYRELKTLDERIDLAKKTRSLVKPLIDKNVSAEEIILAVEEQLPLALHSMLPLSVFFEELTPKQIVWELSRGVANREVQMWKFAHQRLELFIKQLLEAKKTCC
jgi:hypothetical protein